VVDVLPEVAVVFPYELIQLRKLLAYAAGVFDAVLPGSNSSLLLASSWRRKIRTGWSDLIRFRSGSSL
jgi:hypothetical protein